MLFYIVRRAAYTVPIALAVSLFCFSLVHIAPGDPLTAILPPQTPPDVVAQVKRDFGLDEPLPVQFGLWLWQAMQGNLGYSIGTGRSVFGELTTALSNSLVLAVLAASIGVTLGCLFGLVAGYLKGTWVDRAATGLSVAGVCLPHYWLGLVLVIVFAVELRWLPAMGGGPSSMQDWVWDWSHLRYAILPAATMSVVPMGIITRTVRALVADILAQEFIEALRAKGLTESRIFLHVAKNAAPAALAVAGLQVGYLLGGSILIETVFAWPGSGLLLNNAIFQRDLPMIQGTILALALIFVMLNLLVDIVQAWLDPRMDRR
jgi:peptide/nickel transport system permease protein